MKNITQDKQSQQTPKNNYDKENNVTIANKENNTWLKVFIVTGYIIPLILTTLFFINLSQPYESMSGLLVILLPVIALSFSTLSLFSFNKYLNQVKSTDNNEIKEKDNKIRNDIGKITLKEKLLNPFVSFLISSLPIISIMGIAFFDTLF